ncbi:MAG: LPS assembly lipoprotein LptE [Desulfuromonadaceae bacterium]|nr:LPS assembly lipoprotein LptE [Desulfuromonadaceae bacterium]
MMMRRGRILPYLLLLFTLTGCGYHLTNAQTFRNNNFRNVWIPYFSNESISPTAQTVLRRAFYDELHALRGLDPAASQETADLSVKAKLISYSSTAVSYNAHDQAREYKLSLKIELEAFKNGQPLPLWKGQLQSSKQYPADANLALQRNAEEQALDAAARILAHRFISAIEESY